MSLLNKKIAISSLKNYGNKCLTVITAHTSYEELHTLITNANKQLGISTRVVFTIDNNNNILGGICYPEKHSMKDAYITIFERLQVTGFKYAEVYQRDPTCFKFIPIGVEEPFQVILTTVNYLEERGFINKRILRRFLDFNVPNHTFRYGF